MPSAQLPRAMHSANRLLSSQTRFCVDVGRRVTFVVFVRRRWSGLRRVVDVRRGTRA
jgi:hypothetical protein